MFALDAIVATCSGRWIGGAATLVVATACTTFDGLQRVTEDGGDSSANAPPDARVEAAPVSRTDSGDDSGASVPIGPPQRLVPPDATATAMGYRAAIEGNTAIVGAWDAERIGSAYVIERDATRRWNIVQTLTGDEYRGVNEYFGVAVAMSGDWALIGAHGGYRQDRPGHVFAYHRDTTGWTLTQRFAAPVPANGDQFGYAVAMQGDTAVVGAPAGSDYSFGIGALYVFRRNATGQWALWQTLDAPTNEAGDVLGSDVEIDDGMIIGCADYDDDKGTNAGAAYVHTLSGDTWAFTTKLLPPFPTASNMVFCGDAASLDGNSLFIGSWNGGAFVLTREQNAISSNEPIPAPAVAQPVCAFGWSVEVQGEVAIVGMRGIGDIGSAYLYRQHNGIWQFDQRFGPMSATSDLFSWTIEMDGSTALIGATAEDGGRGALYFYEIPP